MVCVPTPAVEGLNIPPLTPVPEYDPPEGDPPVKVRLEDDTHRFEKVPSVTFGS